MNKTGLVLESTEEYVCLLTPEGEYLKVPSRGKRYEVGSEIEIEGAGKHQRSRWFRLGSLAAGLLLVVGLLFALQSSPAAAPAAYLDLDINPSLSLSLDEAGLVLEIAPLNPDGEDLLAHFRQEEEELIGQAVQAALEGILDKCLELEYVSRESENFIFISLAAPEGYPLSSEEIQLAVREHVMQRELDAYLKVSTSGMQDAEEARGKKVSLNAIQLQRQMAQDDQKDVTERDDSDVPSGPPPAVQELLKSVPAADVLFQENEFVGGRESARASSEEREVQEDENQEKPREGGPPSDVPPDVSPRNELKIPPAPTKPGPPSVNKPESVPAPQEFSEDGGDTEGKNEGKNIPFDPVKKPVKK